VARPDLARYYRVRGTPHTVLNGTVHLQGSLRAEQLVEAMRLLRR
jgi:hypothetical protein